MIEIAALALTIACLVWCVGIFIWQIYWVKKRETFTIEADLQPISVVIACRNEEENLLKNLPALLNQDYSEFELVLVDDRSTDSTSDIMKAYELKDPRVRHIKVKTEPAIGMAPGKKFALTLGIKAAKNDWLIFTDADCCPVGRDWIRRLAMGFQSGGDMVLGTGVYARQPSLLSAIIDHDTVSIAAMYTAAAKSGSPYMGVGRSLAYTKMLWTEVKGFSGHMQVASGDDDLFVSRVENRAKIVAKPDALTISQPASTWVRWFAQKSRHHTTSRLYDGKWMFLLGTFHLAHLLVYLGCVCCLWFWWWPIPLGLLFLMLVFKGWSIQCITARMNHRYRFYLLPLADVMHALVLPLFTLHSLMFKAKWKN